MNDQTSQPSRPTVEPKWVLVEFAGHGRFYVEAGVLRGERSGALAPREHIRNDELDLNCCFSSDTYAHVYPGRIMRYGSQIGTLADLKRIEQGEDSDDE